MDGFDWSRVVKPKSDAEIAGLEKKLEENDRLIKERNKKNKEND
jgi:hypothetical protein